ncbi:hypothetical protein WJX72_001970 [[Myrmecia] bisecta]|uniref:NF-kappa-B inhibitor-like protein 1 n=1 Tax=[Myrmecia] bisecta TaxID=41462 RepID=A0AAW1QPC2_9CHLO
MADRTDAESPKSPNQHKRKKRKKEKRDGSGRSEYKLLLYAALGDIGKLKKLISRHPQVNLDVFDAEGNTPLHQACRHGHRNIVRFLMRQGADLKAEDLRGNTPAHLAASKGHLATLALLLEASPPPNIDASNAAGETVRELAGFAMERDDRPTPRGRPPEAASSPVIGPERPLSDDWDARLAEEVSGDEQADADEWESYGTTWFGADLPGDEDAYARRIWEEMERRKQGTHFFRPAEPQAAPTTGFVGPLPPKAEQARHAKRKADYAADAQARSDKILEEERARDAAWRQAVAKGDMGSRRASYEARWHLFVASHMPGIRLNDIPWIADDISPGEIKDLVLYGTSGSDEAKKRLRQELMRWHPDKFVSRFGERLDPSQRAAVLEKVKATSQTLNTLIGAL